MKYIALFVILALSTWALLPPRDASTEITLGQGAATTQPSTPRAARKFTIRMDPGPMYLPGVIPENAKSPVHAIRDVADAFEKLYPDTRVEFVGCPESTREWLVTQLSSAQAPDVIQVNVEDAWQDTQKNWYVPLDTYFFDHPNPFVTDPAAPGAKRWWDLFKYPVPTMGTRAPDGHMYCVTLDMIETGIFYNKTLFNQLHLREPQTWAEFIDIQQKLRSAGHVPLLIEKTNLTDWGIDLLFDQVYGPMRHMLDLNYDPRRGEYLDGYLDWDEIIFHHRHGFFTPHDPRWRETFRLLKDWRQYMSQDLDPTDVHKPFATQNVAMLWHHSMEVNRLVNDPALGFEWGVFYLPPMTTATSRFCDGHPMAVIGGSAMQYCVTNTAVSDTSSSLPFDQRCRESERLKRVIAFLQFLTTPDNCRSVVNEVVAFLPNIKGVEPHAALKPFDEFLSRHYAMTKWYYTFDLQFDEVLLRQLELYLAGGISEDDFLAFMDRNLTTAAHTIVRRKNLDFTALESNWRTHAPLRTNITDLPPEAIQ